MKTGLLAGWAVLLIGLTVAGSAFAEIGRIETKRERIRRELAEGRAVSGSSWTVRKDYEEVERSFLRQDFQGSLEAADHFLKKYPQEGPLTEKAQLLSSMSLAQLGRAKEARAQWIWLASNAKEAGVRSEAQKHLTADGPRVTAAVSEVKVSAESAEPSKDFFTVQVGSFSSEKNAKLLVKKLSDKQYEAYLLKDYFRKIFRVRVGRFTSKEEAFSLESRLKKDGYPTRIYP